MLFYTMFYNDLSSSPRKGFVLSFNVGFFKFMNWAERIPKDFTNFPHIKHSFSPLFSFSHTYSVQPCSPLHLFMHGNIISSKNDVRGLGI